MNVPGFSSNKAVYSGTITSNGFELGTLLRQPYLGSVSLNATIDGVSFDPEHAQIKTDATISQLTYNGYTYKNISAEGLLAKNNLTENCWLMIATGIGILWNTWILARRM